MVAQLKGNGYSSLDKDRLRQRLWLGKKDAKKPFKGLMVMHDEDGHTASTHGAGESGETGQRDQLDIWLDTLIMNEKEARRKRKEAEDAAAGRKNTDAEAAKGVNEAFAGKAGRRGRAKGGGAAASATGTPLPPDFTGAGSTQQSTGSGQSASHSNSWGWQDQSARSGRFSKHPRLTARPFSLPLHLQKAWWLLSFFHATYFAEHEAPVPAPTGMADQGESEMIGFKVVKATSGAFAFAPLHRHDPGYKTFLSEQEERTELLDAFDVYEGWRVQAQVSTIAAAAILISEGLDALPTPASKTTGAAEIAQMGASLRAGAEAQAVAMKETTTARNDDRAAQRAHDKSEAEAGRVLERERMAAAAKVEERRHEQMLARGGSFGNKTPVIDDDVTPPNHAGCSLVCSGRSM